MHLIFIVLYVDAGKKQPKLKCFIPQYFPCRETKEKRREIKLELQRNEMFEQKIISLTCSLQA